MPEIHPAVATPRRMDVDHGSGERTAGAAAKTRDQIAADQIQFILRQDWFHPETLKKYIGALKNWQPNQLSVIIDGQIVSYNRVVGDLQQFLRSLPPDRRQNLAADGLIGPTEKFSLSGFPLDPLPSQLSQRHYFSFILAAADVFYHYRPVVPITNHLYR